MIVIIMITITMNIPAINFKLNLSHILKLFTYSIFKTVRFLKESSEIDFKEQLESFLMKKLKIKLVATLVPF